MDMVAQALPPIVLEESRQVHRTEDPLSAAAALIGDRGTILSAENRAAAVAKAAAEYHLNPTILSKAAAIASYSQYSSNFAETVSTRISRGYTLLEEMSKEPQLDLLRIKIMNHLTGDVAFDESRLRDYTLRPITTAGSAAFRGFPQNEAGAEDRSLPYIGTPTAFLLCYKGVENAVIGMWPARDNPDQLMISQLQGVQKRIPGEHGDETPRYQKPRGLDGFNWGDVLVEYATTLGKALGYSSIAILSAKNNYWTGTDGNDEAHLPLDRGLVIYDRRAERLHFEREPEDDSGRYPNWVKRLN